MDCKCETKGLRTILKKRKSEFVVKEGSFNQSK